MPEPDQEQAKDNLWEDRKLRSNGKGGYLVNVPKSWAEALKRPFSDVVNARLVFEIKEGKLSVRLLE